jgi:hypothetical protein
LCPLPSHWYSSLEKIYFFPSCPSFFKIKHILIVQGGFCLDTSGLYILCFYQITLLPSITYSFLSPCSPYI